MKIYDWQVAVFSTGGRVEINHPQKPTINKSQHGFPLFRIHRQISLDLCSMRSAGYKRWFIAFPLVGQQIIPVCLNTVIQLSLYTRRSIARLTSEGKRKVCQRAK